MSIKSEIHDPKNITAIILAAGLGSRLKENTSDKPKCLVEVAGVPMLSRMLVGLSEIGVARIVIVVGYMKQNIIDHVRQEFPELSVDFVVNENYATTGSVLSLQLALNRIAGQDALIIEADVVLKTTALHSLLLKSSLEGKSCTILAPYRPDLTGTFALTDANAVISWDHESVRDHYYPLINSFKTVNITLIKSGADYEMFRNSVEYICDVGTNRPLEYAMQLSIDHGLSFGYVLANEKDWYEVDTPEDLLVANEMFSSELIRPTLSIQ